MLQLGEKKLFLQLLLNREAALAQDQDYKQMLDPIVALPQYIRTIMYKAWQVPNILIPRALVLKVIKLLQTQQDKGVIKESYVLYQNLQFLVEKKDGFLQLINNIQLYNKYTIRDAFLLLSTNKFSKSVVECVLLNLVDAFSRYNQVSLDEKSCDITTFATLIGLFRMYTLLQGATNLVAQFIRIIVQVMLGLISKVANIFLDNIIVQGLVLQYKDKKTLLEIRHTVLEYLQNLNKVLVNCELASLTIAVAKSQQCKKKAVIIRYFTRLEGCKPDQIKVEKIRQQLAITSLIQLYSFFRLIYIYYIQISKYTYTTTPLYQLIKKNIVFLQTIKQEDAKIALIRVVTTIPILIAINYQSRGGIIILTIDASIIGQGVVLTQERSKGRLPYRFKSSIQNNAESQYNVIKQEYCNVLYTFKKLRCYLYSIYFVFKTNT